MKRFLFSAVLVVIALVLLVVAGAGIFLSTLDLGKYRDQLSAIAEDALGRPVIIEGEIGHSFIPLGLNLERVTVKNTPEFGVEDFLLVENVALRVDLVKLLSGAISIDEVSVGNTVANLVVSKAGNKNWELGPKKSGESSGSGEKLLDKADTANNSADAPKELQLDIRNVSFDNTAISYVDLKGGADMGVVLDAIELSNIAMGIDMPVTVSGVATDRRGGQRADFDLKSVVKVEKNGDAVLRISDLQTSLGKVNAAESLKAHVKGEIVYAGQMQSVNVNEVSGSLAGIDFSTTMAVILPGGANLQKGYDLDVRGEINLGAINSGHLAAIEKALGGTSPSQKGSGNVPGGTDSGGTGTGSDKPGNAPDFSALKPLFVKLDVNIKSFAHDTLRADNIRAGITADGGRVTMPYSLGFYGGEITGTAHANLVNKPVTWKVDSKGAGIDVGSLMQGLTKKSDITGTAMANASLSGSGLEPADIKRTAAGTLSFTLADSVVNMAMPKEVKDILNVREGVPVRKAQGDFAVRNGLVNVQKLDVDSSLATAQGKGSVNLLNETLNITIDVQPGGVPPSLPLVIDGSLKNPSFNWHASRMLEDTARQIIEDPVGSIERAIDIRDELKTGRKAAKENIEGLGKELEGVGKELEGLFRRKK